MNNFNSIVKQFNVLTQSTHTYSIPTFNTYILYVVIFIIVLVSLWVSKPRFVTSEVKNENINDRRLSYKKLFTWTLIIAIPIIFALYFYKNKR